jgi:predicted glycogen debranching enzyme
MRGAGRWAPSSCWLPISSSSPTGRLEDAARARAAGEEVRSVIAGYHWFTDWGRDTMISLEGLTCATGRLTEAGWILRTFGQYVRDGLIPNMFPDGSTEGLYHTADASLWFFHAIDRYLRHANDRITLNAAASSRTSSRDTSKARGSASTSIPRTAS